jgi:hypothetical protein
MSRSLSLLQTQTYSWPSLRLTHRSADMVDKEPVAAIGARYVCSADIRDAHSIVRAEIDPR